MNPETVTVLKRLLFSLACFLVSLHAIGDETEGVLLVEDGTPAACILLPQQARSTAAAEAASRLAKTIEEISGARMKVVSPGKGTDTGEPRPLDAIRPDEKKHLFLVVADARFAKANPDIPELASEEILIRTTDAGLVLAAGSPPALHDVTTEFLRRLGCRMLWPGKLGRFVPKNKIIRVAPTDFRYAPPMKQRRIRYRVAYGETLRAGLWHFGVTEKHYEEWRKEAVGAADGGTWMRWHHLNDQVVFHGGHAFSSYWEKYGKEHPEWFALQADGTRNQDDAGTRERLCVSNPGLIAHIAEEVVEKKRKSPGLTSISLAPNDGGYSSFCMCEACRKLDPPDAPKIELLRFVKVGSAKRTSFEYPSLTDRYVRFWNAIAERVGKSYPDLLFVIDAYGSYKLPPVREKLHPNLVLRYATSNVDRIDGWLAAGVKRMFWRPNILLRERFTGTLAMHPQEFANAFHKLRKAGMLGTDFDNIQGHWATQGISYYAAARLIWNPQLTSDEILDEYCNPAFGDAAPVIRNYLLCAEEAWRKTRPPYEPETLETLYRLLDKADEAAADEPAVRERIAFLRFGLNFATLQQTISDMAAKHKAEKTADDNAARRLLQLGFWFMRDLCMHHANTVHIPTLISTNNNFPRWRPLDWGNYVAKTRDELVAKRVRNVDETGLGLEEKADKPARPEPLFNGRERGLDEMLERLDKMLPEK